MNDEAEFRFLDADDIDELMVLVAAYSQELSNVPMTRAKQREYRRYLRELLSEQRHFMLLLVVDDAISGFVDYRIEPCRQDKRLNFGEIVEFYVAPPVRRRGLGRRMARRAVDHLDSLEADMVNLSVLMTNKTGYKFWQSIGFRDHCVRKRLYL